jgi:brefeldin A-inhibited guanine nucleotide-exchange protein
LSSEAIVYFVDNICQVSAREMSHPSEPRVFSLQKIVEITYYNMGRVRYVWSRMWRVLSEHFAYAGSHENPRISMYAIDSLRQLAAKFLDKEELSNYQFQKVFLKPFEVIMARNPSSEIREFILQCFSRMIFTKISNIKSGWISVFTVRFFSFFFFFFLLLIS